LALRPLKVHDADKRFGKRDHAPSENRGGRKESEPLKIELQGFDSQHLEGPEGRVEKFLSKQGSKRKELFSSGESDNAASAIRKGQEGWLGNACWGGF